MAPALLQIATSIGLPLITSVLEKRIGKDNADLAEAVVQNIAQRAGVPRAEIETYAKPNCRRRLM